VQYVDAQQVLLSSVTARAQLCKKCGSPLNPQTCDGVHVAWLSQASSQRLSKRLAGSNAAGRTRGSSSSNSGRDKLVNRVVAVRRCLVSAVNGVFAWLFIKYKRCLVVAVTVLAASMLVGLVRRACASLGDAQCKASLTHRLIDDATACCAGLGLCLSCSSIAATSMWHLLLNWQMHIQLPMHSSPNADQHG
jgi:hypothetical protein